MRIPGNIDIIEYCDENGAFTEEGGVKLSNSCDAYFSAMGEFRPGVQAGVCSLKGRINERLQERRGPAYESIVALVNSEEYSKIAEYDYELECFPTAVKIYQMERGGTGITFFDQIEYIDNFQKIYQQMIFYFRRIQLNLAKPIQQECMTYLRKNKFSVFMVAQILIDCEIGNKDDVAIRLARLYMEQGSPKEALFLVSVMMEQYETINPVALNACREEIMESL
ncbi:MAG TPA: hypothetical protein PLZ77_03910 [Lachnospiraceae bacterium]|nr:hypothetical protein [Lachnospiraceae bacterium]HPF29236.1 hypothetical protein [Lachnospiraceae bacterium]